jgi:ceramide glucosyltransferase
VAQPWGGAMAIDKIAFEKLKVAALWRDNVVDDCSLAALLQDHGQRALMVSGANVLTPLGEESFGQWWAWWVRQLQYMKYCFPGTWILAGAGLAFLGLPPLAGAVLLISGHKLLGAAYFLALGLTALTFRRAALRPAAKARWLAIFPLFLVLSLAAYLKACCLRVISWRGVVYTVGKKGVVLSSTASTEKPGPASR